MFGDHPDPEVSGDGSFAYEATTGYGFVKLKFEGRLDGVTATGKLVVEDRWPMSTSDGRLDSTTASPGPTCPRPAEITSAAPPSAERRADRRRSADDIAAPAGTLEA